MVKAGKWIAKHRVIILIFCILLFIPSLIGMAKTKINYDLLSYLPESLETVKGQDILVDEYGMGAFSMVVVENMELKDVQKLETKISEIPHVKDVLWYDDVADISLPVEMIPEDLRTAFFNGDATMMLALFDDTTSSDVSMDAVTQMRKVVGEQCFISGMTGIVTDIKDISLKELPIYVVIATIFSFLILELTGTSFLVPVFFLISIGAAILYNLGSNVFLGQISYITQALTAVLQLGVTMDYSIFLLNSYEENKRRFPGEKERAMGHAIANTFKSVVGSSVTTVAGFIALCFMTFALGKDLGIVMAKGVIIGVLCCVTLLPSLILIFDKPIEKTRHKPLIRNLDKPSAFITKHYKVWIVLFVVLLFPAIYGNNHVNVYYNIAQSLPDTLPGNIANEKLSENFDMSNIHMILMDNNIDKKEKREMLDQIDQVDGVKWTLGMDSIFGPLIPDSMIPDEVKSMLKSDNYELAFVCSEYESATPKVNKQIKEIDKIVKSTDQNSMVIGEAPLMKDLEDVTNVDLQTVNIISILAIFIIIFFVFKSAILPVILVSVIEFAIFINMAIPFYQGTSLPFVASIVIGTIQLGATVDYAILMTSRYQKERLRGKTKMEAISISHKTSMLSIISSGLSFFAATFGVSMYSEVDMIGSICTLLARGAIISMIVVIFLLPAMFMIFDKPIIMTTFGKSPELKQLKAKKEVFKMKKKQGQFLLAGMSAMMAILLPSTSVFAAIPEKEQTVYVTADENGNSKDIIVSNWLKNQEKEQKLTDKSNLSEITNVKGNETFQQSSDGTLVWDANGKDIYYQGKSQEELPVTVKLTYYLNGKQISPERLAGKSGKLKIRIDYDNHTKEMADIQGNQEEICTPFMMMTAMVLPTDTFTNVEITNGQILSDGNNNIAVGLGFPGLAESLQLQSIEELKDYEIPDYAELTADVKDFSLAMTATVATTGFLDNLKLKDISNIDDLKEKLDTLTDSSNALVEGSQSLKEGIETLDSSADTFVNGLEQADNGTQSLKDGIDTMNSKKRDLLDGVLQLTEGMKTLQTGSASLQDGVSSYTDGVARLNTGIAQTAEGATTLNEGTQELNTKKDVLIESTGKLGEGASKLHNAAGNLQSGINDYTAGVQKLDEGLELLNEKLTEGTGKLDGVKESMLSINNGSEKLIQNTAALKTSISETQDSAQNIAVQLETYRTAAEAEVSYTNQAIAVIQNFLDSQGQSQMSADELNNQTNVAIANENVAVNARANAQQQSNVVAALNAAGISAEDQAKVMSSLGEISVGVQTSASASVPQIQQDTNALEELGAIKSTMETEKAKFDVSILQTLQEQFETINSQCDVTVEDANNLAAGVQEFTNVENSMNGMSVMMEDLVVAVKQLKQESSALCAKNEELNNSFASLNDGSATLKSGITSLSAGTQQVSAGISKLADGSKQLEEGATQLKTGSDALIANNNTLNQGVSQLSSGAEILLQGGAALSSGTQTLGIGITKLTNGAASLKAGTSALLSGGIQLKDGTAKLKDGSIELSEGMAKFDKEGIQKITGMFGNDLQNILDRLNAISSADSSYKSFDGQNENGEGKVKFIIETAGIE